MKYDQLSREKDHLGIRRGVLATALAAIVLVGVHHAEANSDRSSQSPNLPTLTGNVLANQTGPEDLKAVLSSDAHQYLLTCSNTCELKLDSGLTIAAGGEGYIGGYNSTDPRTTDLGKLLTADGTHWSLAVTNGQILANK